MDDQALSPGLVRAALALAEHERQPTLARLRACCDALASVDLLGPEEPDARLALRGRVLTAWLTLAARVDTALAQLEGQPNPLAATPAERNRLTWQFDALDREVAHHLQRLVLQFYTPAPVDRAELQAIAGRSALPQARRTLLGL